MGARKVGGPLRACVRACAASPVRIAPAVHHHSCTIDNGVGGRGPTAAAGHVASVQLLMVKCQCGGAQGLEGHEEHGAERPSHIALEEWCVF